MQLSEEQDEIAKELAKWLSSYSMEPYQIVCGYAGTGKTTLLSQLRNYLPQRIKSIAYCSYTGKAASVLKSKIQKRPSDLCGTIHSLMYKAETEYDKELEQYVIKSWTRVSNIPADLIIVDEGSMVSQEIWNDLLEYKIPIIVFGDSGQLPPVNSSFNLLNSDHYQLNTIHRQALNNPIIKLSEFVRHEGYIPNIVMNEVFVLEWDHPKCKEIFNQIDWNNEVVCICGTNKNRVNINKLVRERYQFKDKIIYPSEKIVCLNNNNENGIMNGEIATVTFSMPFQKDILKTTITFDNEHFQDIKIHLKYFNQEKYDDIFNFKKTLYKRGHKNIDFFDYGYAISCHKSQGSEWKKVVLFDDKMMASDFEFRKKWLYTAITRAKEKLFVIV